MQRLFHLGESAGARYLLFAGLFAIFAITFGKNLAFNLHYGRLSAPTGYDDVTYLLDGLRRLMLLQAEGWGSFWSDTLTQPPRAPVSTLLAMLGFGIFGPAAVSAYVMNGIYLAVYLAVLAWISRPLGNIVERLLFVALFTIVPAVRAMLTEFRPDMAAGLLFAVALLLICETRLATASARRLVLVAAFAVLAALVKPSGAVVVLPGLAMTLLISAAAQIHAGDIGWRPALARLTLPVAVFFLLLAPFAIVLGPLTVAYIYQTLVTTKEVWSAHAGPLFHATYHLLGVGGFKGLGAFAIIGIVIVVLDIRRLWPQAISPERTAAFALYAVVAFLYVAMAMSSEKTAYQGSFFYFPFLLAVAKADVRVLLAFRREGLERVGRALLLGVFLLLMLVWPLGQGYTRIPPYAPDQLAVLAAASDRVASASLANGGVSPCGGRPIGVLATNPGPITPEAILFRTMGRGVRLNFDGTTWMRTLAEAAPKIDASDFVMVADPRMPGLDNRLPGVPLAPQIGAHLEASPDWRKEEIGTVAGRPFWLFKRIGCGPFR